ncbi:NAD(+)--dinitrogen-reductase ADP-D-ribosyltransferase [Parathalassolituus penaei]|uniref:NAD(+)--dinitrogen-reductase ADP-D-ribosyltransferase n=1 Tax=Parathalassolituus penaei TaxID=2997323 RepID=A0A9X3EAS8_9GAMM|nr:NAD(+)--dinitrogen-reductase ADP-D-ribosyltransferase [Parathalassolituus penaei]MCY0964157.1 hypothetical protein [Parathalassolituus penaei]
MRQDLAQHSPTLPRLARLAINRCNIPADILGSPGYQQHPIPLLIDGIAELHSALFARLNAQPDRHERQQLFEEYLRVSFLLEYPEQIGLQTNSRHDRHKADYRRLLRGWLFNSDSQQGAVLKGWVESRFGLLPRFHQQPIRSPDSAAYLEYLSQRMAGLYNTNGLEAQLDLLYSFAQHELQHRFPQQQHQRLYRAFNHSEQHEWLSHTPPLMLLNNLSSFSDDLQQTSSFGDHIWQADIPLTKVLYFPGLLPTSLQGENEWLVIGGLYQLQPAPIV